MGPDLEYHPDPMRDMSIRREHATGDEPNRRHMDRPQRPARGARGRCRPRTLRLPRPGDRAAAHVPRPPQGADRGPRRPDPHRRGARLPLDRPRPHVPQPEPVSRTRSPASGSARPRSSRSASELVELYNPADIYAAFAEAAREAAGTGAEPTAEDDLLESAGISPEETVTLGEDPYAAAADSWAAGQAEPLDADDDEAAARSAVRPRARVPGAQPAQRGAPARRVRGRGRGRLERPHRRAGHRRRRRRAARS